MIPAKGVLTSHIIVAYNIALKDGSSLSGFFYDIASVGVRYLNNPDIPVPEFLNACRIYSEALAREN